MKSYAWRMGFNDGVEYQRVTMTDHEARLVAESRALDYAEARHGHYAHSDASYQEYCDYFDGFLGGYCHV